MKNKALVYPILILLISLIIYLLKPSQEKEDNSVIDTAQTNSHPSFDYLPTSTTHQIIRHNFYTLSYHEEAEQAEWVAYELSKEQLTRTQRKRPYFIRDKKVKTKSANYKNYKNSGYSKGHLCPAGDRKFSKLAFKETFLTSNISPQKLDFNAGIWNRLEGKVRYWAGKNKKIYVITGGILHNNLKTIGTEKVAVPTHFYKILLDYTEPQIKAIAFLMPHHESKKPLYQFVVSIDKIEELTAIDFFPALPDELEEKLERSSDYKSWSFR